MDRRGSVRLTTRWAPGGGYQETAASTPLIQTRAHNRGFTLLEVMVAMGIAAIVLVTVYRLQIQSIAMEATAQFHMQAPLLAEKVIADMVLQTPSYPVSETGRFENGPEDYAWELNTRDVEGFSTPTGQNLLKQIDVRIYRYDGKEQFRMRTYRLAKAIP